MLYLLRSGCQRRIQTGCDAAKQVSGIKCQIAVDTQGVAHAVSVTTAEVTDRQGALFGLKRINPGLGHNGFWVIVAMSVVRLSKVYERFSVSTRQYSLSSGLSDTPLSPCQTLGWLSAVLPGWRKAVDYGKNCKRKLNTSMQLIHMPFLTLLLRRR